MRSGIVIALVLLLVPLLTPAAAFAQRSGVQPLDRLLPQIRRAHPGEFYDADGPTPGPGGSQHYHLKWLTPDGRILWLDTDARTGRVLGEAPGRDMFDRRWSYGPPGAYEDRRYAPHGAGGYEGRGFEGHGGGRGWDRGHRGR